ncbi:HNH endonuclease signature motif containing protein [Streptococcus suis]|uniref:HNH endonuclease signature motif containing protein n=1 Tax=Streptococcus suis TaxID=1307 RepID=UPI001582D19F|nr:HNH endonuclease signature motif containing protein [Streptococcus suis]MDG4500553.1 HNH endonuclease [Streptococcus suis]MDG4507215.1 HNH endonuclease [Streptococcus suis]MDG4510754.1 HNH endonuclease [Streptococcus suis]HEL1992449.1 HNH endonuclease [Streptococcus suis]
MARLLTDEQHDYFVKIQKGRSAKEVAKAMNDQFGVCLNANQIKNYRRNHGLKSGLTGHFEKGQIPHNKGKKYPGMRNSGQFKKGNRPANYLPVGTVNYTTDGYPKIKVADPDKWEYLHRQTWEKHHGLVPDGHSVVFLDGDKTNWDISNLACLSKNEIVRMNRDGLFASDADLTKVGIGYTKLKNKIIEVKRNG